MITVIMLSYRITAPGYRTTRTKASGSAAPPADVFVPCIFVPCIFVPCIFNVVRVRRQSATGSIWKDNAALGATHPGSII